MQEDTQKRMVRYLNDALAVETGGLVALQDIGSRSNDLEVKQNMENISAVATSQIERLTQRIKDYGGTVSAQKGALNSALGKGAPSPERLSRSGG
jgi:vacuolar-type H+-ATPase subunit D/Vma8